MIASSFFCEIEQYVVNESWKKEPTGVEYRKRDPCAYCGWPADSWDHIESVRTGKKHTHNITRACRECNSEKSSMKLILFLVLRRYPNKRRHRGGYFLPDEKPYNRKLMLRQLLGLLQKLV